MYDYAKTVEVPNKALDPIAAITLQRFNEAVRWQSVERVGGKSLRQVLRDCYDQWNGLLSCEDQDIANEIGVDAYVSLTSMKSGVVQSFLTETLVQADSIPWTIAPTPIPDLSDRGRMTALAMIKEQIYGQRYSGDVEQLIRQIKTTITTQEFEYAKESAASMEQLITDQCLEGDWNTAMQSFITDFTVYPFAVMQGPVPIRKPVLEWSGDQLKARYTNYYGFNCISPWDFWYSPDSPDTQRGTGVFIRQRWTRQNLLDAASMNSYIHENVIKVLEGAEGYNIDYHWMSENPDQPDNQLVLWANCSATIDVLVHYGFFSGKELHTYGITGLDDLQFYNATVTVVNGVTIQVVIPPNPTLNTRPIFTASFYKTTDRIPNASIPQRIRDVERCYLAALRFLMSNSAAASGPIVEADYSRLQRYMTDEDIGKLIPNTIYFSDSELGNNRPAFSFYPVPSVMGQYLQLLQYFMDLGDRVTNIPAALHGTAIGSGVNRTFRGAAMLQGNAVKSINAAVNNIDRTVFSPMGQLLFNYNMLYEKDDSIKGDCKILAQGVSGLLQKEIDRQNSYEVLQLVASSGNQLAPMPGGPAIMVWALNNVFKQIGVPKELLSTTLPSFNGIPGGGEQQPPGPGQSIPPEIPMGGEQ